MASKRKINLEDFDTTVTLGTGKLDTIINSLKAIKLSLIVLLPYRLPLTRFIGSFGRVKLAKSKVDGSYSAFKILKKADIIKLKQVDHVISENTILMDIDHPFLVRIFTSGRASRLYSRWEILVLLARIHQWRRAIHFLENGRKT